MSRPVRPEQPLDDFYYWSRDEEWQERGQARGDVTLPTGHEACLTVQHPQAWRDLSPLLKLRPDDLYRLSIGGPPGESSAGDSCIPYIAHLAGLQELDLRLTNISTAGRKSITALKSLRRLMVPSRMDDNGMAYVTELPALTGLYLREDCVTSAGLKHLAKLRGLAATDRPETT
jgi:hypothetical protein